MFAGLSREKKRVVLSILCLLHVHDLKISFLSLLLGLFASFSFFLFCALDWTWTWTYK